MRSILAHIVKLACTFCVLLTFAVSSAVSENQIQSKPGEYIIKFNEDRINELKVLLPQLGSYSNDVIKEALNDMFGFDSLEDIPLIDAMLVEKEPGEEVDIQALLDALQADLVEYIEPNYIVSINATPNDNNFGDQWGLHNTGQFGGVVDVDIDAPEAWDTTTGDEEVVVGVIDTGVDYSHNDLNANMWVNTGEIPNNGIDDDANGYIDDIHGINAVNNSGDPMDDNSHGTHCAGIIGAVGNNTTGISGVNWNVKLMGLKFLTSSGSGFTSDAVESINYAVMMKQRGVNIRVLSNSWGGGGFSLSLRNAIEAANNEGILVVAAAGNSGVDNDSSPLYPANYDVGNVVSVASVDRYGNLSSFSNYGATTVDLAAPGSSIRSTIVNNSYAYFSGTSMATPHVAGVAALVLSEEDGLNAAQLKQRLLSSVTPLASLTNRVATNGMLNANNAVNYSGNRSPSISEISNQTSTHKEAKVVSITASDPDDNSLSFSAALSNPESIASGIMQTYSINEYLLAYDDLIGNGEKWFKNAADDYFYILPNGKMYLSWPSTYLGDLGTNYHTDPDLLLNTPSDYTMPVAASFSGAELTLTPSGGYVGEIEVVVTATDGSLSDSESFTLTLTNQAPVIDAISNQTINKGDPATSVSVFANDGDGDDLNYAAEAISGNANAVALSFSGSTLTIDALNSFIGTVRIRVSVDDGIDTTTTEFDFTSVADPEDPTDADGDGVTDYQEYLDGTDPEDSGSFLTHLENTVTSVWNSYLGMLNIVEIINPESSPKPVTLSLFAKSGELKERITLTLDPEDQFDVILNGLSGFVSDSYGIVKLEFDGRLEGRIFYYRQEIPGVSYEYAYAIPFSNPTLGESVVGFNTFQPSLRSDQVNNVVANWLSIVNLAGESASFTITTFDLFGDERSSRNVTLGAFQRMDVDGGHVSAGINQIGMHRITPTDNSKPYTSQLIRYGSNNENGTPYDGYSFAFPLMTKAGNGREMIAPISKKFGETNWLEIQNSLSSSTSLNIRYYNTSGQMLSERNLSLAGNSQAHLYMNDLMGDDFLGYALITPSESGSITVQSMFYFRDELGGIVSMYGTQATEATTAEQTGSYNRFFDMENWLKIANNSNFAAEVRVVVKNTNSITEVTRTIPANGFLELALHDQNLFTTELNTYGTVEVSSTNSAKLFAEVLRIKRQESQIDFAAPTVVR